MGGGGGERGGGEKKTAPTTGLGGGGGWQSSVFRCHRVSLVLVTLSGSSGCDRSETSFELIAPHSYPSRFLAPSMRRRADHVREV